MNYLLKARNRAIIISKVLRIIIKYWPIFLFICLAFYTIRGFLFKNGYFLNGEYWGSTDYFFFLKEYLKAWTGYSMLGHSNIGFPTTYGLNPAEMLTPPIPHIFLFMVLSLFEFLFGGSVTLKAYVFLELLIPFLGMYLFSRYWFRYLKDNVFLLNCVSFLAGFIYTINFVIGDRIIAGHFFYDIGYGLFPLFLLYYFKSVDLQSKIDRKKNIIISGLLFATLLWVMPHLLILALLPIVFYYILFVDKNFSNLKSFLLVGICSVCIGFISNIYLWLPALFYTESYPFLSNSQYALSYVIGMASHVSVDKILTLSSDSEKLWLTGQAHATLFWIRLAYPLLGITAIFLSLISKRWKETLFLLLLAICGVIFGMGVNYPFTAVYTFLYEHVIFFSPFRDTSKFIVLYIFGLSLLLPAIFIYFKKLNKFFLSLIILFIIVFVFSVNPVFNSGNFGGSIVLFNYPGKYDQLKKVLNSQAENFRVAVYPNDKSVNNYDWFPKSTSPSIYVNIFSAFLPLGKDLAVSNGTISNYSSRYLDYMEANIDKVWAAQRLGESGVKYLIVDKSMKGYAAYTRMLNNNKGVQNVKLVAGFDIFYIKNFNNQRTQKKKAVYYFGDLKGIRLVPSDLSLINLGQNSVNILSKDYARDILLYNSSLSDLFLTSLSDYRFSFFPEVRFSDAETSFMLSGESIRSIIMEGVSFYNPESIFTGGIVKSEKKTKLTVGKYRVFLSVLSYPDGADNVKITLGDASITKPIEKKKDDTLIWINFGSVNVKSKNPFVSIYNLQKKYLVVDSLLIVPENEYSTRQSQFNKLIKNKKVTELNDTTDFKNLVPSLKDVYVFPQSYSPYWNVCGSDTFIVNFYALGAVCDNNKAAKPYFKPTVLYESSVAATIVINALLLLILIV